MEHPEEKEITTLEELKQLRNRLQIRRDRFGRRDQNPIIENESSYFRNVANSKVGFFSSTQLGSSSTSITRISSFEQSSKEPSNTEYEKLVREYFTNNLHSKCTFPIDSYELLKR